MPIYEYRCTQCLHTFELKQGFDAETVMPCPKCKADARRRINAVGIIFKGSGFYATDHSSSHSGFKDRRDEGETVKDGGEAAEKKEDSSTAKATAAESAATPSEE
ncbi:MAG: putative regulatory protein, FmdB family [Dehalococcoidia bacterium]|nr:putative regulatory protein, FmdB family [Dehalococcoidia bacterium]